MHNFERVHILGGPGTGKSYLAEEMSARMGVPHIDLDTICWNESFTTRTTSEERLSAMQEIAQSDSWVVEGAYCSTWTEPTLEASDAIVSLEMPHVLQKTRLLRRLGARAWRGETTLAQARDLLQWVDGFERSRQQLPERYAAKTMRLAGKRAVQSFLLDIPRRPHTL